jgi:N-acetylneuraminate synthase
MDVHDLARFVELSERIHGLLGTTDHKAPIADEATSRKNARRSIVLSRDVDAGHQISPDDLTCKRPGTGVSPLQWDEVIGRTAAHPLAADQVLRWQDLSTEND